MGIKDNFSQAVKELWKKDGQEQSPLGTGDKPTELDSYLRQGTEQSDEPKRPSEDAEVPLETPYYRDPAQNMQQNSTPLQSSVPDWAQAASEGEPGVNMNVQNIRQNFGQNAQNQNVTQNPNNTQVQQPNAEVQPEQQNAQAMPQQNVRNVQAPQGGYDQSGYNPNTQGAYNNNMQGGYGGGGYVPPSSGNGVPMQAANEVDETTIISKNTIIDGNIHSLANMQIDGNIKGNIETTRNIDMSGKVIGDITCNNAGMNSAAMQGNVSLKGRMRMDRDTILIGDLSSQYADINGRIRGKLDIVGKAELKRDAIVFGDINASTIAVTDGAIIQGYVNTTFLSKEDSRNVFPEAISLDNKEAAPKTN